MSSQCLTGFVPIITVVAGIAVASPAPKEGGKLDSEHVSQLLADAKTQAFQLNVDASALESYTRSNLTWESHAAAVNGMKEHVKAAGRTLTKLEDSRNNASPWQATAIDRIKSLLKEMALNTESVIEYMNKNPKRLGMAEYRDHVETTADVSSKLAELVADFVDYGQTKNRLERLTSKLELPGK